MVVSFKMDLAPETLAMIDRLRKEYDDGSRSDFLQNVIESWAQHHRDQICDLKGQFPDFDENYDPKKEGYCSHHWCPGKVRRIWTCRPCMDKPIAGCTACEWEKKETDG